MKYLDGKIWHHRDTHSELLNMKGQRIATIKFDGLGPKGVAGWRGLIQDAAGGPFWAGFHIERFEVFRLCEQALENAESINVPIWDSQSEKIHRPWGRIDVRPLEAKPFGNDVEQAMKNVSDLAKAMKSDPVKAPSHYRSHPSGVECIQIIQHFSLNVGNAIKYLWRAGLKEGNPTLQEFEKAKQYIDFEIARLGLK